MVTQSGFLKVLNLAYFVWEKNTIHFQVPEEKILVSPSESDERSILCMQKTFFFYYYLKLLPKINKVSTDNQEDLI